MNPQEYTNNDLLVIIFLLISAICFVLMIVFAIINYLGKVEFDKQSKRFEENTKNL